MLFPSPPGHDFDGFSYTPHKHSTIRIPSGSQPGQEIAAHRSYPETAQFSRGCGCRKRYGSPPSGAGKIHELDSFYGKRYAHTPPHAVAKVALPKESLTAV